MNDEFFKEFLRTVAVVKSKRGLEALMFGVLSFLVFNAPSSSYSLLCAGLIVAYIIAVNR